MARLPRVYTDRPLEKGILLTLPESASRHLLKVMRLRPGDALRVFDGLGLEYEAELASTSDGEADVLIGEPGEPEPEPRLHIHLVLGVSRGQRMDLALQKATELGVSAITPVLTERSVVRLDAEKKMQRARHWRQVIISACEQCGRCRLPELYPPVAFPGWIDGWERGGLLLDPRGEHTLADMESPDDGIVLLVGPEGGLSPAERASASARNFEGVRLGPRILRTETAPLAAIAAIQMRWGDFR